MHEFPGEKFDRRDGGGGCTGLLVLVLPSPLQVDHGMQVHAGDVIAGVASCRPDSRQLGKAGCAAAHTSPILQRRLEDGIKGGIGVGESLCDVGREDDSGITAAPHHLFIKFRPLVPRHLWFRGFVCCLLEQVSSE